MFRRMSARIMYQVEVHAIAFHQPADFKQISNIYVLVRTHLFPQIPAEHTQTWIRNAHVGCVQIWNTFKSGGVIGVFFKTRHMWNKNFHYRNRADPILWYQVSTTKSASVFSTPRNCAGAFSKLVNSKIKKLNHCTSSLAKSMHRGPGTSLDFQYHNFMLSSNFSLVPLGRYASAATSLVWSPGVQSNERLRRHWIWPRDMRRDFRAPQPRLYSQEQRTIRWLMNCFWVQIHGFWVHLHCFLLEMMLWLVVVTFLSSKRQNDDEASMSIWFGPFRWSSSSSASDWRRSGAHLCNCVYVSSNAFHVLVSKVQPWWGRKGALCDPSYEFRGLFISKLAKTRFLFGFPTTLALQIERAYGFKNICTIDANECVTTCSDLRRVTTAL